MSLLPKRGAEAQSRREEDSQQVVRAYEAGKKAGRTERDTMAAATWAGLMVGTALEMGLTPQQIQHAMKPWRLKAIIEVMQQEGKEKTNG